MSRNPTILYVGSNVEQRTKPVAFEVEDAKTLTVDYSAYCGIEGTTLSSAAWTVLHGSGGVSLGTTSKTSHTTQCLVTAADTGIEVVQVEAVFANAERLIHLFRCEVMDHEQQLSGQQDNYWA